MAGTSPAMTTTRRLAARDREHRHDLDGLAWKDRKMRMILEYLRGGLVRGCADDGKGGQQVADIGNAFRIDFLGLSERPAHGDDGALVLFDPALPGRHAPLHPAITLGFGERLPGSGFRGALAAKEDSEVGIIRAHRI